MAVYVRGRAARFGIGSALLRSAEDSAMGAGASSIHIDASLAAVEFYKANGFEEIGRGEHRLWSGRAMACVFMRKAIGESRPSAKPDGGSMDSVSVGVPELGVVFVIAAIVLAVVFPAARICGRLGFPRWLGVLAIIPIVNLLLLWYVALARWPASEVRPRQA